MADSFQPDKPGESFSPDPKKGTLSSINEGLSGLREQAGRGIEKVLSGGTPERSPAASLASQFLNPVPGSIGDAALMVADPLIAVGPGGVIRKAATTAATHGLKESMEPDSNLAKLALSMGLGGATGAGGGLLKNVGEGSRAGERLRQTWRAIMEHAGSQEMRDVVRPLGRDPFGFTEGMTLREMRRAASRAIDNDWTAITSALPQNHLVALHSVPPGQINAVLREVRGPVSYLQGPGGTTIPMISATDALAARNALKKANDDLWHGVERDVMTSIPANLQQKFKGSLANYFKDQRAIDHVQHIQDVRELPSGINPTDMPGYIKAGAEDVRNKGSRGLYHLSMGLTHPTSPYGAVHLGEFAREALGGRGSALSTYTPPSRAKRILGKAGAAAAGEAGAMAQETIDQ